MLTCRTRLLITCAASALLVGLASTPQALAADLPTSKAPVPMLVESGWYTEGYVEVGGRFFLNQPQRGAMQNMGNSLAKYYEYSTLKPGPFSNIWLAAGTKDGLYRAELWGKNIGYSDQSYGVDVSKAGSQYLTLGYDQTPHVYSMGAYTPFYGIGGNVLWVTPGFGAAVTGAGAGTTNAQGIWGALNANSRGVDIGIRRDTISAEYRYTPTSAWDVRANFSNTQRTGTQIDNVVQSWATNNAQQVPKPINDSTKNYGLSAEYEGQTPWEKTFTFKLGYNGSSYTDNYKYYLAQNPFCYGGACNAGWAAAGQLPGQGALAGGPVSMMSTAPSNFANGGSATFATGLPFKSRYVGTVSITNMQQNDQLLPFTVNPNSTFVGGVAAASPLSLPRASLNGNITTYLSNNVITTDITPDIKSKLTYRYYNFSNRTPTVYFPGFIGADIARVQVASGNPFALGPSGYAPLSSISTSYVKQNASEELTWKPWKTLNLGANVGWEHYDYVRESTSSTDEFSGKVWADYKPYTWLDFRSSALVASRTNNNYNYMGNLGVYQWAPQGPVGKPGNVMFMPNQVEPYLGARNRFKLDFQMGMTLFPGFRMTPSIQYVNDDMPLNNNSGALSWATNNANAGLLGMYNSPSIYQMGQRWNRAIRPGIDLSYQVNSSLRLFGFYMYERVSQGFQMGAPGQAAINNTGIMETMAVNDTVHTVRVGMDAQPLDRVDLKASYTFAKGHNSQPISAASLTLQNYMPSDTVLNRADITAKYTFADSWVKQMGLDGKLSASLNYAFEQNRVTNWQTATLNYVYNLTLTGAPFSTFMGAVNPNFTVHRLAASLAYKW